MICNCEQKKSRLFCSSEKKRQIPFIGRRLYRHFTEAIKDKAFITLHQSTGLLIRRNLSISLATCDKFIKNMKLHFFMKIWRLMYFIPTSNSAVIHYLDFKRGKWYFFRFTENIYIIIYFLYLWEANYNNCPCLKKLIKKDSKVKDRKLQFCSLSRS